MQDRKEIAEILEKQVGRPMSRADRRAHDKIIKRAMRKNKDTGIKAYNTLEVAMTGAQKIPDEDRKRCLDRMNFCFDLMKKGTWRAMDFNFFVDMLNTAVMLTGPGFNILSDHLDKFEGAQDALNAISARLEAGKGWTCYAHELKAMETAIEYHDYQLMYASVNEFHNAVAKGRKASMGKKDWKTVIPGENPRAAA